MAFHVKKLNSLKSLLNTRLSSYAWDINTVCRHTACQASAKKPIYLIIRPIQLSNFMHTFIDKELEVSLKRLQLPPFCNVTTGQLFS